MTTTMAVRKTIEEKGGRSLILVVVVAKKNLREGKFEDEK